ncbi:hypothetical protein E2C01_000869 [Portunus trituberculatus]|uniref:Uncharacterized protein n=1 Tax=Portunus trituberculatus TaxID=210409 RepID=A0A5B7CG99_PORTR|nr:hypothetical protein [Portunus trituberculatus]
MGFSGGCIGETLRDIVFVLKYIKGKAAVVPVGRGGGHASVSKVPADAGHVTCVHPPDAPRQVRDIASRRANSFMSYV